jgi:hypothetical protein
VLGVACGSSQLSIAPPRVNQGGRAVAIAVSQSDPNRLVVASASGGLFRTFNGGVSFQHLDGFPTLFAVDVAIASLGHNVIIATAREDWRTISGGGIWRSTDDGASWTRPAGWPPAQSPTCKARPGASGISHILLSRTFHVATDCGLAVSNDNGASFTTMALDAANPRLFAVLVTGRSTGVAADNKRLWFLQNGQWMPALGGPDAGGTQTPHAFASPSWAAPNIFYHAGRDRNLWYSTTSGGAWLQMHTKCTLDPPEAGCDNREPFVRVGRGLDGNDTHLDVYYGDGFALWRQAVTTAVPQGSNAWLAPDHMDHRDPADLAFTPGFTQPLMLATDGGVHLTPDNGKNWKLTGSNYGGFTALQIGEITGRQVGGSKPHLDLYYATHDNDIKGSDDGGASWKGSICCEGAMLRADAANPTPVDGPVTGRKCDNCKNFIVPAHLGQQSQPPSFKDRSPGGSSPPFQLIGKSYLQEVPDPDTDPASGNWFLTQDEGASWALEFSLPEPRVGFAHFAGDLTDPVTYIGVKRGNVAGLFRVSSVVIPTSVRAVDSIGLPSLGIMGTDEAAYAVFGVDPANPDHLLAFDVALGMRASATGGSSWFDVPGLNTVVTDTNRFVTSIGASRPFVTTIAFDPANSCHILIGTMQNGVIRSADGGITWKRIAKSPVATWVTSFYFPPSGPIWVSTNGRGLWRLSVDRQPPASGRCSFPSPQGPAPPTPPFLDSLIVFSADGAVPRRSFAGLGDSVVCSTCSVLLAHRGWLTDVAGEGVLRAVGLRSGFLSQRNREGREVPLSVPNFYASDESPALRRLAGGELARERRVRGLVLDGTRLVALLVSRDEAPIAAPRLPSVFARWARSAADSTLESADSLEVFGYQFLPGTGTQGVALLFDEDTIATGIPVGRDGRFAARLGSFLPQGLHSLTAVQRDGRRLTQAQSLLHVPAREAPH